MQEVINMINKGEELNELKQLNLEKVREMKNGALALSILRNCAPTDMRSAIYSTLMAGGAVSASVLAGAGLPITVTGGAAAFILTNQAYSSRTEFKVVLERQKKQADKNWSSFKSKLKAKWAARQLKKLNKELEDTGITE